MNEEKQFSNDGVEQFLNNFLTFEEKKARILERVAHHKEEIIIWETAMVELVNGNV